MAVHDESTQLTITPQVLLKAYACGIFPMAESAENPELHWIEPSWRGIIPLDHFHVPRRLKRTVRAERFEVVIDHDFEGVLDGCAAPAPGRRKTWINEPIRQLCAELFRLGHCHTVECRQDGHLVGGLYGIELGGAFFGESMFSFERDASKVGLVHLVARLKAGGFSLLDTQFVTDHLTTFGALEISKSDYAVLLDRAIMNDDAHFHALPDSISGADALKAIDASDSDND
ncbi:leucyl/phenylalanyl-tRNA--protein transferase [Breoghania corrubedonensis]|uniref:Leucyl/phenylalanyl-tRNA--protein transferase n=1 Tax=Breoghania corrubedonensis TaxID=665038 RepID=A0A2T5V944_9HYPH|nr:leucyl/phenylalanyl-tRNA--protein transferase [Breoghania corrubedonensis]PTW60277.1 leucyl/phenylalanyl-tRNA--protein transferase [Breoghania corrubedonensis]